MSKIECLLWILVVKPVHSSWLSHALLPQHCYLLYSLHPLSCLSNLLCHPFGLSLGLQPSEPSQTPPPPCSLCVCVCVCVRGGGARYPRMCNGMVRVHTLQVLPLSLMASSFPGWGSSFGACRQPVPFRDGTSTVVNGGCGGW
jgi:hypothetical protein